MSPFMSRARRGLLGVMGGLAVLMATAVHAGSVTYVYTDPQGTPLAEADASGNITATFDYAPYGSQALGTAPNGPGYTGHVNDPDTGLVYMQARYYDPAVGRFISTDPVGPSASNPFNFNRYGYANNNPIDNMDPDGRCTGSLFAVCPGTGPGVDTGGVSGEGYVQQVAIHDSKSDRGASSGKQQKNESSPAPNGNKSSNHPLWNWIKNRSSFSAELAGAFGAGGDGTGTKQWGDSPDSLKASFVVGEGGMAAATYNFKVWSSASEVKSGLVFDADPSSYLKVKLGAGVALGFNVSVDPHGNHDVSISVGGGAGEEVIYKPPVTAGVNYNMGN